MQAAALRAGCIHALFIDATVAVARSPGVHAVIFRRRAMIADCAFFVLVLLGALALPFEASAQASCRSACWEGYGACYKATNNRQRCQAQLQRCLNACIRSRRHHAAAGPSTQGRRDWPGPVLYFANVLR